MTLNKQVQYGVLFALYLARAGRAKIEDASITLNISKSFLEQTARKMRLARVVSSVRGPGGGYELMQNITLMDVIDSLSPVGFLSQEEYIRYTKGQPEERAFAHYIYNLNLSIFPILNRKVTAVMQELVVNEMAQLNRLDVKGLEN